MKKLLIFMIFFLISCGPSEEEIQERIDEAVFQATSTTTSTTTTTTLPTEECDIFINGVTLIKNDIEKTLYEKFEGEGYDERLQFLSDQVFDLNILESFILAIEARTDNELEILYQLENFRYLVREHYALTYKILYQLGTDYEEAYDVFDEAELLGNQLSIRINNYKCEN